MEDARIGEDRVEIDRAEQHEHAEDAEREAEVADAVDDERLDRRGIGRRLLVPEADQQIGGETHAFPAEEHLHEIVRGHQHQHGEGEQRQIGEEARPVRIVVHVADRIDVHEADTVLTTTSITAVSVSMRSAQSASSAPDWIQRSTGTVNDLASRRTRR